MRRQTWWDSAFGAVGTLRLRTQRGSPRLCLLFLACSWMCFLVKQPKKTQYRQEWSRFRWAPHMWQMHDLAWGEKHQTRDIWWENPLQRGTICTYDGQWWSGLSPISLSAQVDSLSPIHTKVSGGKRLEKTQSKDGLNTARFVVTSWNV